MTHENWEPSFIDDEPFEYREVIIQNPRTPGAPSEPVVLPWKKRVFKTHIHWHIVYQCPNCGQDYTASFCSGLEATIHEITTSTAFPLKGANCQCGQCFIFEGEASE